MNEKPRYRIEGICKATVNGRNVKLFSAYQLNQSGTAYIFLGQFTAPVRTANKNLVDFID